MERRLSGSPGKDLKGARDSDLVAWSKAGDLEAFGELVRRYQKPVFRIVLRMVRSPDDADDLTQDTFVRAHRGLKTFKDEYDFHPWLYRIAVNQAINFLNKRKRQAAADLDEVPEGDIRAGPEPESPLQSASRQELLTRLELALDKLPEEQRTVFLLRVQEGLSYEEIAETMETPKGTVMSRLARARMALRKHLGVPVDREDDDLRLE
jgi:RNA polymerase sigma factor (sigma-70 family)